MHGPSDDEVHAALRDLGGHDLDELAAAFRQVDNTRPTVLFAGTVNRWWLPVQGHPGNHSALLTEERYAELAARCGTDPDDPWHALPTRQPAGPRSAAWASRTSARPAAWPRSTATTASTPGPWWRPRSTSSTSDPRASPRGGCAAPHQ